MNMISTGSFLTEMDASNKRQDLVKKTDPCLGEEKL